MDLRQTTWRPRFFRRCWRLFPQTTCTVKSDTTHRPEDQYEDRSDAHQRQAGGSNPTTGGDTDHFTYLGRKVSKNGGSDENIKNQISKARHGFNTLRPIWDSKALSLRKTIRASNVKAVLLCLLHILNIRWPEKISNANLWEGTNQNPISQDVICVREDKWGWTGHTLRKPADDVTRQALDWNQQI